MSVKGKSLTVAQKKLLTKMNLNPKDFLYLRMGPNQQGLIFCKRDTGEKIMIDNRDGARPSIIAMERGD